MPQYQVDSEQIQSSSAAVNASIQSIRQAVQGMYAISTICRAFGAAGLRRSSQRSPNSGVPRSSRWSSRLNQSSAH